MTPKQLKKARLTLGLSLDQMALMLGYSGPRKRHMQYSLENGLRTIREPQIRLARAYLDGYRPDDWPIK